MYMLYTHTHTYKILVMHAKSLQSCQTLYDPMNCSPPGSSVHGDSPGKNTGVELPCPTPGNLPHPGIESSSLMPTALADRFFTTTAT